MKNLLGSTMKDLSRRFKRLVVDICEKLDRTGLFDNREVLCEADRSFLEQILNSTLDPEDWTKALSILTRLLHDMNDSKVIILVDEYDTPTSYAVQHGYFHEVCPFL
jgi:hypothetical protein